MFLVDLLEHGPKHATSVPCRMAAVRDQPSHSAALPSLSLKAPHSPSITGLWVVNKQLSFHCKSSCYLSALALLILYKK